jgi:adenylosuccinate synthase
VRNKIVIGLLFGDEGKGLTTSSLCAEDPSTIVVRFNGGHQAGHTVLYDGIRHVFSSFGSGTLQGMPTYWSKYCTLYPTAFLNELEVLISKKKDLNIKFYLDPLSPITTPYDIWSNQSDKDNVSHGSVGVGFGKTIKRNESFYKLHAMDLKYPGILKEKLKNIAGYYGMEYVEDDIREFILDCQIILNLVEIQDSSVILNYNSRVFEGAQGVLLDQDFGFFPNVTRSNTTSKNAIQILNDLGIYDDIHIYYVTRSYQTRHGSGYMSQENNIVIENNEDETNVDHTFQGKFRTGKIDPELIKYSLECESQHSKYCHNHHLFITCLDQVNIDIDDLIDKLDYNFKSVRISKGPSYLDTSYHKELK